MNKNYNLPQKGTVSKPGRYNFWLGKMFLCILMFCFVANQNSTAQTITTIVDPAGMGGFELGQTLESNGWTVVNATPNAWNAGVIPGWFSGTSGAYISNDQGATWGYTASIVNASHIYADVTFPATSDDITLKFDWRGNGNDGNWDNLQVYIIDTDITPTTNGPVNQATTITGWTGYTNATTGHYLTRINGVATPTATTVVSYTLTAAQRTYVAGSTKRLVFVWKNDGSGGSNPPASIDNISLVSTAYTCLAPTALTATLPTVNGATISWNAPDAVPSDGYDYYISTASTVPTNAQLPTGNTLDNEILLANLPSNTTHYIWVRSKCDDNDKSAWTSSTTFTTLCDVYSVTPSYLNNFTSFPGACWTRSNAGTAATGPTGTANGNWSSKGYLNVAGNTSATFNLYGNTTADSHWLISPLLDLGSTTDYRLKYNVGLTAYNSTMIETLGTIGSDLIEVLISEDQGATWSNLITYDASNIPPASGATEIIDLSAYQGVVKFAFLVTDNLDLTTVQDADFFIDEFLIEPIPSCDTPTAMVVENVTVNSAEFSWEAGQTVPANGYEYYVSETTTAPTVDGTATPNTTVVLPLSANTTYYAWVRAVCATANKSNWVMSASFRTLCDAGSVPYILNIDAVTIPALPECIAVQNVNGDNKTWQTYAAQAGITGKVMGYPYSGANQANDWFYLQGLNLTPGSSYRLKFKYKDSGFVEKLKVAIGENPIDADMGTELFSVETGDDSAVVSQTVDFTVDNAGIYYIGFQAFSDADQFNLYVGEISVIVTPTAEVDFANLQAFVVNGDAVTAIQQCQTVDVYAQAYEAGVTEADGQATGLLSWIGYATEDTDPATWPESAWSVAAYSGDAGPDGNNDEFKKSYTALTAGTKYFASRFQLSEGPYKYGATNGLWNGTTNTNATLEVSNPVAIDAGQPVAICAGESTDLSVSSTNPNYTYVWSTTGTTPTITVSPVTTTTYTVTATDTLTGCTVTGSVVVTVNATPSAIVIDENSATVCNGAVKTLTATGGVVSNAVYSEDFNQPTNEWVTENTSTGGTPANGDWTLRESGYAYGSFTTVTFTSNDASQFYLANSDAQGSGSTMATSLTSPSIDLSGYVGAALSFYHYYRYNGAESAKAQVSIDGGNNWVDVVTYSATQGTAAAFAKATLNLDAYAGEANVQIRFKYNATWDYYWAIDNVEVSGAKPQVTWAPQTNLFLDANATIPYAGTPTSTVYVKDTTVGTTIYTATAQNANDCSVEATATITITAAVDAPTGTETQDFSDGATLNSFVVVGENLIWYDAALAGNVLSNDTLLTEGTSYYVSQTVNGCESTSRLKVIAGENLAVPGFEKSKLMAYPNPVTDSLTISAQETIDAVQVYNLLGQKVFESTFSATEIKINMDNLAAGTYMINVVSKGMVKNIKVIKR